MFETVGDWGTTWVADSILRMPVDKDSARTIRSMVLAESVTKVGPITILASTLFNLAEKWVLALSKSYVIFHWLPCLHNTLVTRTVSAASSVQK